MSIGPVTASFQLWPVCKEAVVTIAQIAIRILFVESSICIVAVLAPCRILSLPLTAVAASLLAATFFSDY